MVLLPAPAGPSMAIISLRWDGSVIVGMCDSTRLKRGTLQVAWHAWRGARENSNAWPSTRIGACQERCQTSLGLDARGRPSTRTVPTPAIPIRPLQLTRSGRRFLGTYTCFGGVSFSSDLLPTCTKLNLCAES